MSHEQPAPDAPLPACSCRYNTNRTSKYCVPERDYTLLGTIYALWGGTAVPERVRFRCVYCGVVFDTCTDRDELEAYVI